MKNTIKSILRKSGYSIVPYDEYENKLEKVRYNWLINQNINTILDIGASFGQYARKARKRFPGAHIISFEALPDSFQKLNETFKEDKNFQCFNLALSNFTGKTVFRKSSNSGASSLLEMDDLHKTNYKESKDIVEIEVKCDTLDNILKGQKLQKNILMKLDVQGAEKMVLEGAKETLKNVQVIFSEVNFNTLYKGNVLFNDLVQFLYEQGFRVEGIENVSQSLIDGTFLQADVFFKRME
jgi:FkbM family methyltransferase